MSELISLCKIGRMPFIESIMANLLILLLPHGPLHSLYLWPHSSSLVILSTR